MTDAPKIDTQAPDTSREAVERLASFHEGVAQSFHDHIRGAYPVSHKGHAAVASTLRALLAERDLAVARAAAAAQAMREALRDALAWIDAVPSDMPLPAMPGFDRDAVDELMAAAAEPAAALDRLIAERVREAIQPIKEAWDWWQADSYDRDASVVVDAIDEAMNAARGSKEGQS